MIGPRAYDLLYRRGAPWEIGPRPELVALVTSGRLDPATHPRAIDLGCGSGANPVYLAEHGFEATGVDFSTVALRKAQVLAAERGVAGRTRWFRGDLTSPEAAPPRRFDLVIDYGTLDDLGATGRDRMTELIHRLTGPGSLFVCWCFYGRRADLPWFSLDGPSKLVPTIRPGEMDARFGGGFAIERLPEPPPGGREACFLLTRR